MKELKIGIAGLGVVAQGLLDIVKNNGSLIADRTNVLVKVVRVASRSEKPGVDLMGATFSKSIDDLWRDPEVHIKWPEVDGKITLSEKDKAGRMLSEAPVFE